MTKSESAYEFIKDMISKNKTISISTYGRIIQVSPKTYKKWEIGKYDLFKFDSEGSLRIASGKKYNIICTKTTSLVHISAQ